MHKLKGIKIYSSVCDFFETFPSFVYLIPVIFLFNITDTSVLIAAIVYATVPATRYTVWGLNSVPPSLHEAGTMSEFQECKDGLILKFL